MLVGDLVDTLITVHQITYGLLVHVLLKSQRTEEPTMYVTTKSFFVFDTYGNAKPIAEGAQLTTAQYNKLNDIKKAFCVPYVSAKKAARIEAAGEAILAELLAG